MLSHEWACREGTPVVRNEDIPGHPDARCVWCGIRAGDHETPDVGGQDATHQATHVDYFGEVVTTVEAEAGLTVGLEALRHRAARPAPDED